MSDFTKLSALVNNNFTVVAVGGFRWKKWDDVSKTMLVSGSYEKDYRKLYQVETDKGMLDMGTGQIGNLLEAVFHDGKADLIGRTFYVKSNGKTGMDIRYYFNTTDPKQTSFVPKGQGASAPVSSQTDENVPPLENYDEAQMEANKGLPF